MKRLFISFLVVFLAHEWVDVCTIAESLAIGIAVYTFLTFVHQIGERIALPACISFIAALEILLVPTITYWVFPVSMPIDSNTYFSYALPAWMAFYAGIEYGNRSRPMQSHRQYIQAAGRYLQDKQKTCIVLFIIGLTGFSIRLTIPSAPTFIGSLPAYCLLISAFYAYYSRSAYRVLIFVITGAVLLTYTILTGMFGDLFLWLMLALIFGAAGTSKPISTQTKTVFFSLGFAFLLLIQSVKGEYRYNTWGHWQGERSGNANLMIDLLTDRLANPEKLLNADHLYLSFARFNQGVMIGSAMATVPMHQPYANGEVLLSFLYPFVPRLLWPDKPQTGGHENIRRFTSLPQSENTSINLSPIGEGYVNFGYGGILFAGLYGLLLGGLFRYVFFLSGRIPSTVLWLPMLYIGCLTMETDLLSTWGSLVNSALFIAGLFWFLKRIHIQL